MTRGEETRREPLPVRQDEVEDLESGSGLLGIQVLLGRVRQT